jgi:hypothetical protein
VNHHLSHLFRLHLIPLFGPLLFQVQYRQLFLRVFWLAVLQRFRPIQSVLYSYVDSISTSNILSIIATIFSSIFWA